MPCDLVIQDTNERTLVLLYCQACYLTLHAFKWRCNGADAAYEDTPLLSHTCETLPERMSFALTYWLRAHICPMPPATWGIRASAPLPVDTPHRPGENRVQTHCSLTATYLRLGSSSCRLQSLCQLFCLALCIVIWTVCDNMVRAEWWQEPATRMIKAHSKTA